VHDVGDGRLVSVSTWETREQAEEGARNAERWNRENVDPLLESAEAYLGEVLIYEPGPERR